LGNITWRGRETVARLETVVVSRHDLLNRQVLTCVNEPMLPGSHCCRFDRIGVEQQDADGWSEGERECLSG
jgi:hypothetical protein